MVRIALVNRDTVGGGLILGGTQSFVTFDGLAIACVGDRVADHGDHHGVVMVQGSDFITINNIPVCREGDLASCGEPCTGSAFMTT